MVRRNHKGHQHQIHMLLRDYRIPANITTSATHHIKTEDSALTSNPVKSTEAKETLVSDGLASSSFKRLHSRSKDEASSW